MSGPLAPPDDLDLHVRKVSVEREAIDVTASEGPVVDRAGQKFKRYTMGRASARCWVEIPGGDWVVITADGNGPTEALERLWEIARIKSAPIEEGE